MDDYTKDGIKWLFEVIGVLTTVIILLGAIFWCVNAYIDGRIDNKINHQEPQKSHSSIFDTPSVKNSEVLYCHILRGYDKNNTLLFKEKGCNEYTTFPSEVTKNLVYTCLTEYIRQIDGSIDGNKIHVIGPSNCKLDFRDVI